MLLVNRLDGKKTLDKTGYPINIRVKFKAYKKNVQFQNTHRTESLLQALIAKPIKSILSGCYLGLQIIALRSI